jgi:hypothetical protein
MDNGSVSLDVLLDVLAFSAAIGLLVMASRRLVTLARPRDKLLSGQDPKTEG